MKLLKRDIYPRLEKDLSAPHVTMIVGARQVGKTCILKLLQQECNVPYAFFDLELPEHIELFSSHTMLVRHLEIRGFDLSTQLVLFIDEFQYIPQGSRLLKILHDHYPELKVVATGSSSLKIKMFMDESMTGRKRVYELYTLNFREFISFAKPQIVQQVGNVRLSDNVEKLAPDLHQCVMHSTIYGAYPKPSLIKSRDEIVMEMREIQRSFLQRDIISLFRKADYMSFARLMKFLAVQSAQLFNVSEASRSLAFHRSSIIRMIDALEASYIVKLIQPFFGNRKKEQVKMPKLYFLDTGMRNSLLNDFRSLHERPDAGALFENAVFSEIMKSLQIQDELYFWRTQSGAEIDFIIKSDGKLFPLEVKTSARSITKAMQRFIQLYEPTQCGIVTFAQPQEVTHNECRVSFFHPINISRWMSDICGRSQVLL